MKKLLLIIVSVFFAYNSFSQTLVSTEPSNKNAILEEFTGLHCGYCPDGHAIAHQIMQTYPDRVYTIAIHTGPFANPGPGEPNYICDFGSALASQAGVQGYPAGTVNRHVFSGSATTLSRSAWKSSCEAIMKDVSPVNVGVKSEYNETNRELKVTVELYYTSNAPTTSNFINVALIQDSIYGPQSGGNAGNNYRHMHMLRHLITGQWGDEVSTTTAGSFVTRTYTYTVPEHYKNVPAVVKNMHVIAFVTKDHQEIYNGVGVPAINGITLVAGSISTSEETIKKCGVNETVTFNLELKSNIEGTTNFAISLEPKNMPVDWQCKMVVDGQEHDNNFNVELTKGTPKTITLKVTSSVVGSFPEFNLKLKSLLYPNARIGQSTVKVISNITDLIVNGTGGDLTLSTLQYYVEGLNNLSLKTFSYTDANTLVDLVNKDLCSGIKHLWLNISWTFPTLMDNQAEAVMSLMDKGVHLFISGQDIGWDIMSGQGGSNGTEITKKFYTDYLKAKFKNDGNSSNKKLCAIATDEFFGSIASSAIKAPSGNDLYPDQIEPIPPAVAIFNYNEDNAKLAGIRYADTVKKYRVVYLGVGLEMIVDNDARNNIVKQTSEWFIKGNAVNEINSKQVSLITNFFPNPASKTLNVEFNDSFVNGIVNIYDINGKNVLNCNISNNGVQTLDISTLNAGFYTVKFMSNKGFEAKKLIIQK